MPDQILLVDNDKALALSISQYLINEGFSVHSAYNVEDGLNFLIDNKPSLIISDILMPKKDGYYFINYVKNSFCYSSIPFIFMSAKGMTSDRINGYNLGCQHYITKPFDPEELLAIIQSCLTYSNHFSKFKKKLRTSTEHTNNNEIILLISVLEYKVLQLVLQGMTNREIADILNFTVRNVEKYVSRLLSKTGTRNRTHLTKYCYDKRISIKRANDGNRTRE